MKTASTSMHVCHKPLVANTTPISNRRMFLFIYKKQNKNGKLNGKNYFHTS